MTRSTPAPWYETVSTSALLRAAWRAYGDVVRTDLSDAGFEDLPRNGAYVLGATAREALGPRALPSALGVSKQAFSQLVDTLVLRGYVRREDDPEDRRRVVLQLTARGQAAAAVIEQSARDSDAAVLTQVSAEDVRTARRVLGAMASHHHDHDHDHHHDHDHVPGARAEADPDQDRRR